MKTLDPNLITNAERLYELQDSKAPPVDVENIAAKLGILMDDAFTIDRLGYSGEIYLDNAGVPHVWINPADPPVRRRFTLAHECGHFVLHMRANPDAEGFKDNLKLMRRGGDWDYREGQANRFAASLLMPRVLIAAAINEMGAVKKAELARLFEVSEESMGFRLQNLGHSF